MSTVALLLIGVLGLAPQMTAYAKQLGCLTQAVLAESALVRTETDVADAAVALSIYNRSLDGRWGASVCETVHMRYPKTAYRVIKLRLKVKKGKKARVTLVRKPYKTYVYDYSYHGKQYSAGLVHRVSEVQLAKARDAALSVLNGQYTPPEEIAGTLHYMYRDYASTAGALWFDCTMRPLGRAHPESVHMHYRDATEPELVETLSQKPKCQKYITAFRFSRDRNLLKKQQAYAW